MLLSIICPTLQDPSLFIGEISRGFSAITGTSGVSTDFELIVVSPNQFTFPENAYSMNIKQVRDLGHGIYSALNCGIWESIGENLIVINIDDFVDIAECLNLIKNRTDKNYDVLYGDTLIRDDTSPQTIIVNGADPSICLENLRMPASHQAQIIRKSEYLRLESFKIETPICGIPVKLKFASDFDFFARSYNSGGNWIYEPSLKAIQRLGGSTSKHWLRTTLEICLINWIHTPHSLNKFRLYTQTIIGATKFHFPKQCKRKLDHVRS